MKTCAVCQRPSLNLDYNHAFLPPSDDRLAFVERVCSTLIESRFGPAFVYDELDASGNSTIERGRLFRCLKENGGLLIGDGNFMRPGFEWLIAAEREVVRRVEKSAAPAQVINYRSRPPAFSMSPYSQGRASPATLGNGPPHLN